MGERRARRREVRQLDHDPASLVRARKRRGFTQAEVAKLLGISAGHMSEIESGKRNATPKNLAKLTKILRCPFDELAAKVARDEAA